MDSWVINLKCYKYRYKIIFQYITKMGRKIALRFLGLRFSIKFYISTMYQHSHANYHYRNTYVPMNKWSTCCKSAEVTTTYKRIQNFCLEKKKKTLYDHFFSFVLLPWTEFSAQPVEACIAQYCSLSGGSELHPLSCKSDAIRKVLISVPM